jgi:hypothetical protein
MIINFNNSIFLHEDNIINDPMLSESERHMKNQHYLVTPIDNALMPLNFMKSFNKQFPNEL